MRSDALGVVVVDVVVVVGMGLVGMDWVGVVSVEVGCLLVTTGDVVVDWGWEEYREGVVEM